jgi:hypothetical protein
MTTGRIVEHEHEGATGTYSLPAEAGFTSIEAAHLDGDVVNTYIIASKD